MTRRALFGLMAAAALDPEKLLWVPGKKLISIPKPEAFPYPFCLDLHEFERLYIEPAMRIVAERWKKDYDFYKGQSWDNLGGGAFKVT